MNDPHHSGQRPQPQPRRQQPPRRDQPPQRPATPPPPGGPGRADPRSAEPHGGQPGRHGSRPAPARYGPPQRRDPRQQDRIPPDDSPTELLRLDELLPGAAVYETYEDYDDFRPVSAPEQADDPDGEFDEPYEDYFEDDLDGDYFDGDLDSELVDEYEEDEYEEGDPDDVDEDVEETGSGRRRRRKRALGWVAALGVLVLLAGAAYFGGKKLLGVGYADYTGTGETEVVIKVSDGDTIRQIANTLAEANVVASADAFVVASKDNPEILGIQPGYYVMKTKMSGENAVRMIVSDAARVGQFRVRPGRRLLDTVMPDGSVTKGILSRISEASCTKLNGKSTCVSVQALSEAIATADLAKLGVPEWAVQNAAKAEGVRKLEGLIAPGHYNVRPGSSATELLRQVLETSTERLAAAGLPDVAAGTGYGPYEILIIASLIQSEAIEQDFAKVSRVIYNRLAQDMKLQLDSTINYVQRAPTVRTTDQERAKEGPYNTYQNLGLPPTPIASPSKAAIEAAANPAEGDWLYFVKCKYNGASCFSETYAEHQQKAAEARRRGVY